MNTCIRMLTNISLSAVLITFTCWIPGALASDEPIVELSPMSIVVYPPEDIPNLRRMTLRVMAPDGTLAAEEWSDNEGILWTPAGLDDGLYRYEAVVYVDDLDPIPADEGVTSADADENLQILSRASGVLDVINGAISVPESGFGGDELTQVEPSSTTIGSGLLGYVLDFLIPAAQAQDLTASSLTPTVNFLDTNPTGGGGPRNIWDIFTGEATIFPCSNASTDILLTMRAVGNSGGETIAVCSRGTNANNTMIVDPAGDISFANSAVFIDRSADRMGIGTTTPSEDLEIASSNPTIALRDTDGARVWEINSNTNSTIFDIRDVTAGTSPFVIESSTPADTLYLDSSSNVGIGLNSPARQLHLRGSNAVFRMDRDVGTAAFLLVRTTAANAPLKSFVVGTNAFGANDGEFVINDLGSAVSGAGARRMTIANNGDAIFTGIVRAPAFVVTSSRRFKENVEQLSDALSKTQQLQGVRFVWKDTGRPALGLIAEEVASVLPEVVERDAKDKQLVGVNYPALVAVLVEAIKEQQQQMEAQQAKTLAQQNELAALKAQLAELNSTQAKVAALESQMAEFETLKIRLAEIEGLVAKKSAQAVLVRR